MTRSLRLATVLAAMALFAALPAVAAADGPTAEASRNCPMSQNQQQSFPPAAYVTSLRVFNTTCRKGKRVVRAYHRCRKANGGRNGRCGRALRFRCREGNRNTVPNVAYYSRVVCRRGGRKVVHTYQQNI